jgi:hypothetical protein
MFIRLTLFTLLLLPGLGADAATLKLTQYSYELDAASLRLPEEANRSVFIKSCSTCPAKLHKLVDQTTFWVNDEQVSLAQLKDAMSSSPKALVVVSYAIANDNLTWIKLIAPESQQNKGTGDRGDRRNPRGATR